MCVEIVWLRPSPFRTKCSLTSLSVCRSSQGAAQLNSHACSTAAGFRSIFSAFTAFRFAFWCDTGIWKIVNLLGDHWPLQVFWFGSKFDWWHFGQIWINRLILLQHKNIIWIDDLFAIYRKFNLKLQKSREINRIYRIWYMTVLSVECRVSSVDDTNINIPLCERNRRKKPTTWWNYYCFFFIIIIIFVVVFPRSPACTSHGRTCGGERLAATDENRKQLLLQRSVLYASASALAIMPEAQSIEQ